MSVIYLASPYQFFALKSLTHCIMLQMFWVKQTVGCVCVCLYVNQMTCVWHFDWLFFISILSSTHTHTNIGPKYAAYLIRVHTFRAAHQQNISSCFSQQAVNNLINLNVTMGGGGPAVYGWSMRWVFGWWVGGI